MSQETQTNKEWTVEELIDRLNKIQNKKQIIKLGVYDLITKEFDVIEDEFDKTVNLYD